MRPVWIVQRGSSVEGDGMYWQGDHFWTPRIDHAREFDCEYYTDIEVRTLLKRSGITTYCSLTKRHSLAPAPQLELDLESTQ